MHPIKDYQFAQLTNEPIEFSRGFVLAVVLILLVATLIIGGLVTTFRQTTYAANAKLVYLAARAKAIEFQALGNYHVPVQTDLIDLIGDVVNQDAVIQVVDENQDATIDYIVYVRNGLATKYSPGQTSASEVKK